ncbi:hypothetical protein JQC67_13085 [Aurantibacter crassamenti]|uniref:hypothetical protein n=1 Tax=Aurantibacter crassamenti TaxID=1837375 RepID=UPI001939A5E8|nr:hypothetical protein [Aurantibacter crassamenti]MBM1107080.1 hypothetical protein [Aurantibacter crassamenti]
MNSILRIFPWKRILKMTLAVLALLIVFNFYGLYTNQFYFFKFDNYIFPALTLVHFGFLYVLWFKIKEEEIADPKMRNLEYALYAICVVYVFKFFDTLAILFSYGQYENHVIPGTFIPVGLLILTLYIILIGLTLLAFKYRKDKVGAYEFDDMNHIDSWE